MDALIRRRLLTEVTIYPYLGQEKGNKIFGEPYTLMGYVNARQKVMLDNDGTNYRMYTLIIFAGQDIQFGPLKPEDEIVLPVQGRVPIINVKAYQGLPSGTQNMEVMI